MDQFDPTGLFALASLFIQPLCDVGSALNDAGSSLKKDIIEIQGTLIN